MFVKSHCLLTVIWLTFVLLMRSLAEHTISQDMSAGLNNCTFSLGQGEGSEDLMSYCSIPVLDPSKPKDVKFSFISFVCMELYDVSLQLCDDKYDDKLRKIEELKRNYPLPKAEEFCSKLTFYDKRAIKTRKWADVTIAHLKIPARCNRFCIVEDDIHPLCEAIFLGNMLLIKLNLMEQPEAELPPKAVGHVDDAVHQLIPNLENGNKIQPVDSEMMPTGSKKINAEDMSVAKSDGRNDFIDNKKIDSGSKSNDLNHDNNSKKVMVESIHLEDVQNPDQANSKVKSSEPKDFHNANVHDKTKVDGSPSTTTLVPPVVSTISSTGTETMKHEDIKSEVFQSREMELANDGAPLSEDEVEENEAKGSNAEDPISPSGPQDDNYGEPEENTQNLPNSKVYQDRFVDAQDSHFFAYFLTMVVICIIGYLVFHNKQKIIALALEGRRMQGSRRRPNTSSYKKLDSNLEEAVTSTCSSSSVTHVIF